MSFGSTLIFLPSLNFFVSVFPEYDYALLILEHWPDAAEVQRSADLYEDMIRFCVSDEMSELTFIVLGYMMILINIDCTSYFYLD